MQAQVVIPASAEVVCDGQGLQRVDAAAAAYVPGAHTVHAVVVAADQPAGHVEHRAVPETGVKVPGTQGVQKVALDTFCVLHPAEQFTHALDPTAPAKAPAAHVEHTALPFGANSPRAHGVQLAARLRPRVDAPAGQSAHAEAPAVPTV